MASVNKAIILGNLGQDPELKYMPSGDAVCNFSVATTDNWKDSDGNQQEKTEWHRIVAFKRLAEVCGEYLKKGKQVYIEGKLQTRSWEDKDGVKKSSTEIVASQMQMLGRRDEAMDGNYSPPAASAPQQSQQPSSTQNDEDDLPF